MVYTPREMGVSLLSPTLGLLEVSHHFGPDRKYQEVRKGEYCISKRDTAQQSSKADNGERSSCSVERNSTKRRQTPAVPDAKTHL